MTGSNVRSLEQLSLETTFEWRQRWTWCDMWRKAVPCLSRRHRKCTTAECLPLKARDDETGRRSRPKMPSWLDLRDTDEFVGEVARPQAMEASIGQHRQFILDPLRIPQPVQITEERCHVLGSTSSVDQSGSRVEYGPQPSLSPPLPSLPFPSLPKPSNSWGSAVSSPAGSIRRSPIRQRFWYQIKKEVFGRERSPDGR